MKRFQEIRQEVCSLNQALPKAGLVTMHSGNASILDAESGRLFIKPSGMDYDRMTPEAMVEVDLETGHIFSTLRPSVDLPHHLFLYRNLSGVRSIIHTHSNYATAFAAVRRSI
ncbi:MAG: class II aldolase/adducin family protein, partial [Gemmataceae bacterium]